MAYIQDFNNDIFISYAHNDNKLYPGMSEGWVTLLINTLQISLAQKLGSDKLKIWMDPNLLGNVKIAPQITSSLENTAIFLVVLSPSYIQSEWCRKETNIFLDMVKEKKRANSRIFVIEFDKVEENERPIPFRDLIGYKFWVQDIHSEQTRTLGMPEPLKNDRQYYEVLDKLCYDLVKELKKMKKNEKQSLSGYKENRPKIFLAEVTDDLDSLRHDVIQYLDQAGISVVPQKYYSRDPKAFQTEMDEDIEKCKLFVQLLSNVAGKKSHDLPRGYWGLQYDRAKELKKTILQWRNRYIDLSTINDDEYRIFLEGDSIYATGIEEFKREIVYKAFSPDVKASQQKNDVFIFVNNELSDDEIVKEIINLFENYGLGYALPLRKGKPIEIREDLDENILNCNGLIVVYGSATVVWVRNQLRYCHKMIYQRKTLLRAFAVYEGPPEMKDPLNLKLPSMQIINCRKGIKEQELHSFLQELRIKED